MTSASSLAFPGSRTLAGWWRQLASQRPLAFGVGYLFWHRVEVPVARLKPKRIERFAGFVLQVLDLESSQSLSDGGELLRRLEQCLHLDRQVLLQVLRSLESEGLAGMQQGRWSLTDRGRQGLRDGEYPVEAFERQVFYFLERCDAAGARTQPPHFVNVCGNSGTPWQAGDAHPFDVGLLQQCLAQSPAWKQQFGFPLDVRHIPAFPGDEIAGLPAWQRVIVDCTERLLAVLVLVPGPDNNARLCAFAARQDGWALQAGAPIVLLDQGWPELFPELASDPRPHLLQQAWQTWAQPRGLPESEIAASTLTMAGHRLRVAPPPAAIERLRAAKSDVFKGESWLLLGDGLIRMAVQLELIGK